MCLGHHLASLSIATFISGFSAVVILLLFCVFVCYAPSLLTSSVFLKVCFVSFKKKLFFFLLSFMVCSFPLFCSSLVWLQIFVFSPVHELYSR